MGDSEISVSKKQKICEICTSVLTAEEKKKGFKVEGKDACADCYEIAHGREEDVVGEDY